MRQIRDSSNTSRMRLNRSSFSSPSVRPGWAWLFWASKASGVAAPGPSARVLATSLTKSLKSGLPATGALSHFTSIIAPTPLARSV